MTFWLKHQFYDLLRVIGLRDRLRCPMCKSVGTWKPHGGWLDGEDARGIRRWLCKWCGHYQDVCGYALAVASQKHHVWILYEDRDDDDETILPSAVLKGREDWGIWPWRG